MSRVRLRLVLAALVLTASSVSGSATATGIDSIWFRVVQRDGSVVVNPIVAVSVFGPTYQDARILIGGPSGDIVVPLPVDDPVAANRLRNGEPVNLLIRVFDTPPGSPDVNAAYVTASFGVDAFGVFGELSSVNGQTFSVEPGRTDFVPTVAGQLLGDVSTEPALCEPSPNNAPRYCYVVDYPTWSRQTFVPIAYNHGGGADVSSEIRYHSTIVTKTATAFQAGSTGFVEVNGAVAYERENTVTLGFGKRGPNDNVKASLESVFMRERQGFCFREGDENTEWVCQVETTYRPYEATGSYAEPFWWAHDNMNPVWDCWINLAGEFEPVTKSVTETSFSLRLGPSEDWATSSQGTLYANTTITQQTHTGKSFLRRWEVKQPRTFRHQYLYVSGGMAGYDPGSASQAACVRSNLGRVSTESSDIDHNVHVNTSEEIPVPPPTPSPDEAAGHRAFCGRMPDKCD